MPDTPTRGRVKVGYMAAAVLGVVGLLCCGWLVYAGVSGLVADVAFVLVPAAVMAAVLVAAVAGWRTGVLRRWPRGRVVVATLIVVVLIPVAAVGGWIVKATVDAGRGAACPLCAVDEYVWNVLDDPIRLRNFLCADRRNELAEAAGRWRATYQTALDRWRLTGRLEVGAADDHVNGDTATVVIPVEHTHDKHWQDGGGVASRSKVQWRFEVVNDNGWRVCTVELPDVCTQLIHCGGPQSVAPSTTPAPSPSMRPWSDWDDRVRWECFPDAGVWQRPGCATPPLGWQPPGPHYCAPTFPAMLREAQKTGHCRELGWNVG